jgi:hypothetical protein
MSKQEEYASLKPSDFVHGGGLPPEGDYDITNAMFAMWDYNGQVQPAVPALAVEFTNPDKQAATQYYSAGDFRNWEPAADGKRLAKKGSALSINDATNCAVFITSLVNAGYSEDKLGNDITSIIGLNVSIIHGVTKEREIRGQKQVGKLIAVVGKIHKFPGEQPKAAKGKAAAATKANGQQDDATAVAAKALTVLQTVLSEAGGTLDKKSITAKVFQKMPATDLDRGAVLNLIVKDDFLTSLAGDGVLYDASAGSVLYIQS